MHASKHICTPMRALIRAYVCKCIDLFVLISAGSDLVLASVLRISRWDTGRGLGAAIWGWDLGLGLGVGTWGGDSELGLGVGPRDWDVGLGLLGRGPAFWKKLLDALCTRSDMFAKKHTIFT